MSETSLTYLPYYKSVFDFGFGLKGAHLKADCKLRITDEKDGNPLGPDDLESLQFTLRGPGDIIGINQNMIARVEPVAGSHDFEPNYFPFIEFVDPDLPWRYSLDNSTDNEQVFPWLQLIVISFDEINDMITNDHKEVFRKLDNEKELITVNKKYLSDLNKAWATAHVQLTNTDQNKLDSTVEGEPYIANFIRTKPAQHNSRLMCMRKLKPETHYYAFLCPTYMVALKAYKNEDTDDADNRPLWVKEDAEEWIELPVYYKWEFMTSEKGDFESLARELQPSSVDDKPVGTRVVDLGEQSKTDSENLYFRREGAIAKPGFSKSRENYTSHIKDLPFPDSSPYPGLKDELNESLKSYSDDDTDDPYISYPIYGRHFRNTQSIANPTSSDNDEIWPSPTPWIHELNLDMRNRVAGGFGTSIIQRNQEQYMKQCWDQVGDVRLANEILRRTKAGSLNSSILKEKHIDKLDNKRFTLISYPFHSHFVLSEQDTSKSLKLALKESGLMPGVTMPSFRHVGHKYVGIEKLEVFKSWETAEKNNKKEQDKNKIQNRLKCMLFQFIVHILYLIVLSLRKFPVLSFVSKLILKLIWWLKKVFNCDLASHVKVPFSPNTLAFDLQQFRRKYNIEEMELPGTEGEILPAKAELITVKPIDITNDFRPKFDHKKVLKSKVKKVIEPNNGNLKFLENFDPILTWPYIRDPMYRELRKLSDDYVLPGIEYLDNNGVTLMEENPRFIESFMCPLNHEMGRELVWREFPTDQKGTVFTQFWDPTVFESTNGNPPIPAPDITGIHTWNKKLGLNRGSAKPNLVLVLKGDLIRRYPDTIIYCHKITIRDQVSTDFTYRFWSDLYTDEDGKLVNPPVDDENSMIIEPVFRAQMGKDILFAGFPFSVENIKDDPDGEYYFILQENRDLPRYGLDLAQRNACTQNTSGDLDWGQTDAEDNEGYICTFDMDTFGINNEIHSATVAVKTFQKPVRVAFHSSTLLK